MKKKLCSGAVCIIIIASLFGTASCSRNKSADVKAEAAAGNVAVEKPDDKKKVEAPEPEKVEKVILSEISEPEGRDFLLYNEIPESRIMPRDFEIGELQPQLGAEDPAAGALEAVRKFLDSITAEAPDYDIVVTERRDFVQKNIDYGLTEAVPADYRIGLINISADPARAAVRFEGGNGFSEGTIYLDNESGWKILDFHMNFSDMNNIESNEG